MRAARLASLVISGFVLCTATTWAQPVYKSVDKEGNVTYSSTPPEDAKQVEDIGIVSSPTEPNTSGEDDIERIKQAADQLERDRESRENRRTQQKESATTPAKAPVEEPIVQRHRPIIQQPIPPGGGNPKPLPITPPPAVPVPPNPSPPVAVPLGGGGGI